MSNPHDILCGKTNAVLALYLDGDIGGGTVEDSGFDLVCPDALASHLRDCGECQVSLQRARRLDALLAESAGRTMAEAQSSGAVERMFAGATLRATEGRATEGESEDADGPQTIRPQTLRPAGRTLQPAVLVPAALLIAAAASLAWLWTLPEQSANEPRLAPEDIQSIALAPAPKDPEPRVPEPAIEPPTAEPAVLEPRTILGPNQIRIADDAVLRMRERAARRLSNTPVPDRSQLPGELAGRLVDTTLPTADRIGAAALLVQSSRPGNTGSSLALATLIDTLAASRCQPQALADALALVAVEPHFTGYLRATLRRMEPARSQIDHGDLAALTVAARLGSTELDGAVRRAVRRHLETLEVVAAALRLPIRTDGSAALLLACWNDASRRHRIDDSDMARLLFAGQPRRTFDEVNAELDAAQSVPHRVRCLLALASCTDRQSVGSLLEWATASCRQEAYAAAWSLSQLPHTWLDEAAARAKLDRNAFLLRAALARAGLPAAKAWTEPMRLTPRERAVIAKVTFVVFPRFAEWFRDGPRARLAIAEDD